MSLLKDLDPESLIPSSRFTPQDDENPDYLSYVRCETTKGPVELEIHHLWAPFGAQRFLKLVDDGYYADIALFRKNRYILQFGAVKHPQIGERKKFSGMRTIPDDPKTNCFGKCEYGELWDGAVAYAGGGKDSRSDQLFFVHHKSTQPLGHELWETPIGKIVKGYDMIKNDIYGGYNEGVSQVEIFQRGNEYTHENFPLLDYIETCFLIPKPSGSLDSVPLQKDPSATNSRVFRESLGSQSSNFRKEYIQEFNIQKSLAKFIGARNDEMPLVFMFVGIAFTILLIGRILVGLLNRSRHAKQK